MKSIPASFRVVLTSESERTSIFLIPEVSSVFVSSLSPDFLIPNFLILNLIFLEIRAVLDSKLSLLKVKNSCVSK